MRCGSLEILLYTDTGIAPFGNSLAFATEKGKATKDHEVHGGVDEKARRENGGWLVVGGRWLGGSVKQLEWGSGEWDLMSPKKTS